MGINALVFGSGGQLGTELVRLLGPEAAVPIEQASITDAAAVAALINRRRPDVVFNCAAYNAVDRAEVERDIAFAVNEEGPRILAVACRRSGAYLMHFSTNFVFNGKHDEPYIEGDHAEPLSVYGLSKLAGERAVLEYGAHVVVVRTAALYGGPASFPMRILERARAGADLRVVADQLVNPTFARDLAAVAMRLAEEGTGGIVHVVNDGCCGWDDFAREALAAAGVDRTVESISTGDYPAAARRPANGCMASTRIPRLRGWREALHEALNP